MLAFHRFLDRIFKQKLSFSVFFRLWLSFAVLMVVASGLTLYYAQQTLRPSAKRVVEDALVDTSRLLAALVAKTLYTEPDSFGAQLDQRLQDSFDDEHPQWYDKKQKSQFHVYVTDSKGVVIYDSQGKQLGADFSRWNDVYLTLQGKYGARSTGAEGASVMYVASPIVYDGQLLGVLSVGKPTHTLTPYLKKSTDELIGIVVAIMALGLLSAMLMAWWLRHSIQSINRYTQGLAQHTPPHFYLGRELNELTHSITAMKDAIENKAYVTEYVHTLTHELKSPITAIKASGELLADELPEPSRVHFSALIVSQADRLADLVDRLLMLAKLEAPSFTLNCEPVSLAALARRCLDEKQAQIEAQTLFAQVLVQEAGKVSGDVFWLTQALHNLVDNAIAHAKQCVLILVTQNCVVVLNDAPILPEYVLTRAFERYFSHRAESSDTMHAKPITKGTGLGLPLVAQVAAHHGGSVSLAQGMPETLLDAAALRALLAAYPSAEHMHMVAAVMRLV